MSATAREAALKIILEDVEPLIQRAEEVALLQARVETDVKEDLVLLGQLVQRTVDAQASAVSAARTLTEAVRNANQVAEAARHQQATTSPVRSGPGALQVGLACVASALVAAVLVFGGVYLAGGRDVIEQARLGKALSDAWPVLDQQTKDRLNSAMQKQQ